MTSNFNAAQSKQTADGFFSALFDFSFSQYITLKFARVIYLISAVLIGLCWVFGLLVSLAAFGDGFVSGLLALLGFLIVGTLAALVSLISARDPRVHGLGDQDGAEHLRNRRGAAPLKPTREAV